MCSDPTSTLFTEVSTQHSLWFWFWFSVSSLQRYIHEVKSSSPPAAVSRTEQNLEVRSGSLLPSSWSTGVKLQSRLWALLLPVNVSGSEQNPMTLKHLCLISCLHRLEDFTLPLCFPRPVFETQILYKKLLNVCLPQQKLYEWCKLTDSKPEDQLPTLSRYWCHTDETGEQFPLKEMRRNEVNRRKEERRRRRRKRKRRRRLSFLLWGDVDLSE